MYIQQFEENKLNVEWLVIVNKVKLQTTQKVQKY